MRRTIYAVEVTLTRIECDMHDDRVIASAVTPAVKTQLLAHYDGSHTEQSALALYADLDERMKAEHI